ncbi:hypothetical protein [Belliella pelovolcani]|uniref:hypothetical protein n=1 Tax=Belliella pelovolcani TaxID=529505 RepID=UPI00391B9493
MKKITLLILMIAVYANGLAQEGIKKGYFGISLGPSIHTGGNIRFVNANPGIIPGSNDPKVGPGSVGFNFSFVDAGYTFDRNWGIAAKLQGGFFTNKADRKVLKSNYGAILLGPMYSYEIHDDLIIDFKAKGGRFFNVLDYTDEFANGSRISEFDFGLELGATARYHLSAHSSWFNSIDFQNQFRASGNISRINIATGIAFRF